MCCCRRREGLTEACCRPVDKDGQRIPWIHSPASDVFFTVLIVLSTILLGVDIELGLRQVAEDWRDVINWVQFGLLLVFVLELFLRVCTDGCRYFLSLANLLDAFIIFCSLAEYVVVAAIGQGVLLNTLAVMRIFRLLRILRVIRLVRVCPQLYSICINLVSAIRAVSWVFLLLFVFMYISALSCTVLLAGAKDDIIRTNFGSVFASIYIHFVILTVEGFPEIVAAIAEEFGWLWYVYFVGYILFTNIMIMNTVTGVICQTVVSHSAMDAGVKAQSYREFEKLKEVVLDCMVLEGLQYDVNESMDFDMFRQVMRNPGVRACFDAVDICLDLSEEQLFSIIDENGDGELSFDEFFQSLWRLRGSKERLHSLLVQADIVHTHKRLKERMVQLTEDLEDYHREECAELREQLESRVQAMVDGLEAHRGEAQKAREEEEESTRLELSHLLDSAHEAAETARETLSSLEEQIAVKRKRVADLQAQLAEQRLREIRDVEEVSAPQESAQAPSDVDVNSPVGSERRPLLETASSSPPSPSSPASPASPQAPPSPATESGSPESSPVEGGSPSMESPSGKRVRERMASRRRLEELHRQKSATAEARRGSEQPKSHRLLQTFQTHASATRSVAKAATFESSRDRKSVV